MQPEDFLGHLFTTDKQIAAKTVDFGASDMPLKPEVLEKDGLVQFPTVIGGVVPVVNLANIKPGQLKLTGPLLADIFLGKSRVNRSALLLQQQVFLHNKINITMPETGYFCAVPGFLRFKRAVIYGL